MEKNTTEILKKSLKEFYCKKCDYKCARKSDFNKHLKSKKHSTTNTTKIQPNILHSCECGKSYNYLANKKVMKVILIVLFIFFFSFFLFFTK